MNEETVSYDELTTQNVNVITLQNGAKLHQISCVTYTKNSDAATAAVKAGIDTGAAPKERGKWGREIEFLFSCISLSVGLGNVWRFPFIALENGGGAFLIPYIIVLLLIGRPVYYMEVLIGQFSSRGCIKAFDMIPALRGIAYGQVYATALATTYYACIIALTIRYMVSSFSDILPWTYCKPEWGPSCIATANMTIDGNGTYGSISSAELFFTKTVLREIDNLDEGLGEINMDLVYCLLATWIIIAIVLIKGIRSSGKASYFLALFPYVIMIILLCRAVTLPGSMDGIIYFLKPQWNKLFTAKIWYAAITQMFFSLAICFGTLVMYASFNDFRKNVYRDVIIITSIDSFTSILAGCIIFGILGNLAYETRSKDIADVVKAGAGLAFISYPEAIAKFKYLPRAFAILFFFMLLTLGVGSNIGMTSCVTTVIKDRFAFLPHWGLSIGISTMGFLCGLIYTTSGGQFILQLVDFYGCSFIALFLAIAEIFSVSWIYGIKRFCKDIEYMLGIKTGFYWRICWAIITPGLMFLVLIYTLITYEPLRYKNVEYPNEIAAFGWLLWGIGVAQLPLWMLYTIYMQPGKTLKEKIYTAFQPTSTWGPSEEKLLKSYRLHSQSTEKIYKMGLCQRISNNIFG